MTFLRKLENKICPWKLFLDSKKENMWVTTYWNLKINHVFILDILQYLGSEFGSLETRVHWWISCHISFTMQLHKSLQLLFCLVVNPTWAFHNRLYLRVMARVDKAGEAFPCNVLVSDSTLWTCTHVFAG